ncbi:MAG: ParA family protein [Ruminococcaceae bacterium]|nr:ParA family protein [Oscillospiraceae bacterium]
MGRVIAIANQKGGVGKTTSAVNIAASLGLLHHRTLLIDLDPQGSATSGVGVPKRGLRFTVRDLLIGSCRAEEAIVHTEFEFLDLLPANVSLAGAEFDLLDGEGAERHLLHALEPVRDRYDYVIIDCPPSLGMLTVNAMVAADGVIIPMQCEFYALEGLSQLTSTIARIKRRYNPRLAITGILITMLNKRLALSVQVIEELKKHYGDRLFETMIARNVRISEAPSFGMPVYYHDKRARGAKDYMDLARELTARA